MADEASAERESQAEASSPAGYASVIYFHGMGSQRRYEEVSSLIDRIDQYLVRQHRSGASLGILRNIKARVEPLRPGGSSTDIVGHIRTVYSPPLQQPPQQAVQSRAVRFYEVYWAPVMAGNQSPLGVAKWLFKQPLRPWRTLRTAWRERQRLRRAALIELFERKGARATEADERDLTNLMRLYDRFEGLDARRRFPDGTFDEFLTYIAEECRNSREFKQTPEAAQRLDALARVWLSVYRRQELKNAAALALMALALLLLAGGVLFGILLALQSLLALQPLGDLLKKVNVEATWTTALSFGATFASLVGFSRFLTDYLGDVEAWATYEETDVKNMARNKVLDQSLQVLTHVLSDPACERVTIVAHSLGSSIAHDALLALTRRNRAHRPDDPIVGPVPLLKIEHFVTMGSPIDKIEYFFESYSSHSHRYNRVIEALRGDIGEPPFTRNRHPHIHWINFWDQGDLISGPLHSPASAIGFSQRVDNVHVANFHFPDPAASHAGYFANSTVIDALFRIIFLRERSFRTLQQPAPGKPYDYKSVYLAPGRDKLGTRALYLLIAAITPVLGLVGAAASLLDLGWLSYVSWGLLISAVVVLISGYVASRIRGQRNPI